MSPKNCFAGLFLAALCCLAGLPALAQEGAAKGSIAGRLTLDGEPLANVRVALWPGEFEQNPKQIAAVATDSDGGFRFAKLKLGVYAVRPLPSANVPTSSSDWRGANQIVRLTAPDEAVTGINFAFARGGVITGRVTNAEGRPLIGEFVTVHPAPGSQHITYAQLPDTRKFATDDEGNYRIYGLPAGSYMVSVGSERGGPTGYGISSQYPKTFHPASSRQDKARVVTVKAGEEKGSVDIVVGEVKQVFTIAGRLLPAEDGQNFSGGHLTITSNEADGAVRNGLSGTRIDKDGKFQVAGVLPGRYQLSAQIYGLNEDFYCESVFVGVIDRDLENVEIRMQRGMSVSGVAVVENLSAPEILERLGRTQVYASPLTEQGKWHFRREGADFDSKAAFQLRGLPPGRYKLRVFSPTQKGLAGLTLLRVEQNGATLPNSEITIAPGQSVSGVRLVMRHGAGLVRGQVNFVNGDLPATNAIPYITLRRVESDPPNTFFNTGEGRVDAQGRFVLRGLLAGEYELNLDFHNVGWPPLRQKITVEENGDTIVTLTFDIKKAMGGRPQ